MAKIHKRRHLQNSLFVAGALASDTATRLNQKSRYWQALHPEQEFLDGIRHVIYPWNQSQI